MRVETPQQRRVIVLVGDGWQRSYDWCKMGIFRSQLSVKR
jgi:hypothetical protein